MKINKDSVLFYSSLLNFFLGDVVTTLAQLNKFKQWITKFWDTGWEEAEKKIIITKLRRLRTYGLRLWWKSGFGKRCSGVYPPEIGALVLITRKPLHARENKIAIIRGSIFTSVFIFLVFVAFCGCKRLVWNNVENFVPQMFRELFADSRFFE